MCSGDTDFTPFDVGAYASSTTTISGGAVKKTAEQVRARILELASKLMNISAEGLTCRDNHIVAINGSAAMPLAELARHAIYREKVQIIECASHSLTDSPPPFCATFAEVEVDIETGKVRVLHLVSAVDAGVAINPTLAEGQVEGAVAQGIGYTLTEQMQLDEQGRMINPTFLDYKILSAKDMPKLTTILVETDEPLGPYGAKSIGEIAIDGPAPAIANAIYHAIGIRFRKLPILAEDVWRALREKEEKPAARRGAVAAR
jgi:putative selenate reductase molybdopterin-binding subunit